MSYAVTKRCFDFFFAGLGLLVVLPLGLVLGALIKLSDRGPVFYGQMRVGQFGRPFRIWKFRTMVIDADRLGAPLTCGEDSRITPLGRWLRKTKLDELPQLWNVFAGEMSLVGPRPEVPRYVAQYSSEQKAILQYKPGITDLASVLFRKEEELLRGAGDLEDFYLRYCLPKKIDLNLSHAKSASLAGDVWIIVRTLLPFWLGVLLVYSVSLGCSFWLAYLLKSDFRPTASDGEQFTRYLPLVIAPQLLFLILGGQQRGLLSYFSIPELGKTFVALVAALPVQVVLCYLLHGHWAPSRSILVMDFLLAFFVLCCVRMSLRLLRERLARAHAGFRSAPRRVALIGTGEVATNLLLDFVRSEKPARRVVAFFDDDPRTWHKRPHDIPVVGMPECLLNPEWLEKIDEVVVTLPEENSGRIQELVQILKAKPWKVTVASGWPVLRVV